MEEQEEIPTNTDKQPIKRIRVENIYASIWENILKEDGTTKLVYNVNIERRYKDKKEEWQSSNSYNSRNLLPLALVAQESKIWIEKQQAFNKMSHR